MVVFFLLLYLFILCISLLNIYFYLLSFVCFKLNEFLNNNDIFLLIPIIYCSGMTNSNYTELNQLYERYRDQGILTESFSSIAFRCIVHLGFGFPGSLFCLPVLCNDFASTS